MAHGNTSGRGRESEQEDLRVPSKRGDPPRPATEPPGAERSTKQAPTDVDPGSGAPLKPDKGKA